MSGVELYYETCGTGLPILVVHGGPGLDHTYLREPLLALARDNELIFYDQRCSGRSGGSPQQTELTIDAYLHDIEVLRSSLNLGKMILLGHSWGCLLAMLYASQRLNSVQALVLLNPISMTYSGMLDTDQRVKTRFSREERDALAALSTSESFLLGEEEAVNAFMSLWFRVYFADSTLAQSLQFRLGPQTSKQWAKVNAITLRQMGRFDFLPNLAGITCPTLIVEGGQDVVSTINAEAICKAIPQCQRICIEGSGHFSFLEAPETLLPAVRNFLQGIS